MLLVSLFSSMLVAIAFAFLWLITGGSLATAFAVYALSGVLCMATMASFNAFKSR